MQVKYTARQLQRKVHSCFEGLRFRCKLIIQFAGTGCCPLAASWASFWATFTYSQHINMVNCGTSKDLAHGHCNKKLAMCVSTQQTLRCPLGQLLATFAHHQQC